MLQIMELENTNTETYCNHEENNSNEDKSRATTYEIISTSQKRAVVFNKWLTDNLTDLYKTVGTKIAKELMDKFHDE